MLRPQGLEGLVFDGQGEFHAHPYDQARALARASASVAQLRGELPDEQFRAAREAVRAVADADWVTASALAPHLGPLARRGPPAMLPRLGDMLARLARQDPVSARLLAERLPGILLGVPDPEARIRLVGVLGGVAAACPEVALPFAEALPELLDELSPGALRGFVEQGMGLLPMGHVKVRSFLLRESQEGRALWEVLRAGLPLERVARTLQLYAEAHCGSGVRVRSMDTLPGEVLPDPWTLSLTDGAHIYLAPRLMRFPDDEANFRLYKLATAHEAGHIEFGTFGLDPRRLRLPDGVEAPRPGSWDPAVPADGLRAFLRSFPDPDLIARVFMVLEDARVDHLVRSAYPGLSREMDSLLEAERPRRPDPRRMCPRERALEVLARLVWFDDAGLPAAEVPAASRVVYQAAVTLRRPGARVEDAGTAAAHAYRLLERLPAEARHPAASRAAMWLPKEGDPGGERGGGKGAPGPGRPRPAGAAPETAAPGAAPLPHQGMIALDLGRVVEAAERGRALGIQRSLADRGVEVPLSEVLRALRSDPENADTGVERALLEQFRDGRRSGGAAEPPPREGAGPSDAAGSPQAIEPESARVHRYWEWDRGIGDYRPTWATVRERRAEGRSPEFALETLKEHRPLVSRLRRQFQMIRAQQRGQSRGWLEGDELDLDALVAGVVESRAGHSPDGRFYLRRLRPERDVAVAFLVDLSASTKESVGRGGRTVIEVQKQSLILLCEALEALGDRYAIYGFSGRGRAHVTFEVYKSFGEPYNPDVRARIGGMGHQRENRDGAAIRHATHLLAREEARVRLLVLLSDGRPLDCGCDHYNERYAQEDTRMALREAMARRVHPFCITVDRRGEDYLASMYGDVRYAVIDRVESLPEKLPRIYRRLTT
ncbi:hypothetical protein L6R50_22995 [Myxococcota bacterium]|nr:hypothetical protein [Myxococcota bacterium]